MRFVFNLHPISQAGRRGFDPRLPLLELKPYTCLKYPVSKRSPITFKLGVEYVLDVEEVANGAQFRQITGVRGAAIRGLGLDRRISPMAKQIVFGSETIFGFDGRGKPPQSSPAYH